MRISDKRMEMLHGSRTPALLLLLLNPSYSFPWQALYRGSPSTVATFIPHGEITCAAVTRTANQSGGITHGWWLHPILAVKTNAHALCHSTANHRLVPAPTGIESLDSFASVTNAQHLQVWSTSQSFITGILLGIPQTRLDFPDSQDPTRNTTDKVRLSGSS